MTYLAALALVVVSGVIVGLLSDRRKPDAFRNSIGAALGLFAHWWLMWLFQ